MSNWGKGGFPWCTVMEPLGGLWLDGIVHLMRLSQPSLFRCSVGVVTETFNIGLFWCASTSIMNTKSNIWLHILSHFVFISSACLRILTTSLTQFTHYPGTFKQLIPVHTYNEHHHLKHIPWVQCKYKIHFLCYVGFPVGGKPKPLYRQLDNRYCLCVPEWSR